MAKKPSMGRQKIKISKIMVKSHLQVTFSKRRSGLFKKASELCTLCGVEIAIVVFSPAGKVFSFGHPKVESIIDRYLSGNLNLGSSRLTLAESHRMASSNSDLNMQLTYMLNELEAQKKRGEMLDEMRKANQDQVWWEAPIENLNLHQLEQLEDSMEQLKKTIDIIQANNKMLLVESCNSMPFFGANNSISGDANQQYHDQMKNAFNISSSSAFPAAAAGSHQAYSYGFGNANGYNYGYGNGYGYGYGNSNDNGFGNGYGYGYVNDNGYGYGYGNGYGNGNANGYGNGCWNNRVFHGSS